MSIYEQAIAAAEPTARELEMSQAYELIARALEIAKAEAKVLRIQMESRRRKPGKAPQCR